MIRYAMAVHSSGVPHSGWRLPVAIRPEAIRPELLAVTLYRKGAEAVAKAITNSNSDPYVTTLQDSAEPVSTPCKPTAGVASYRTR